jgi:hypothetical protein
MLVQVLEGQRVKEYGIQTIFLDPLSPIVRPLFAHLTFCRKSSFCLVVLSIPKRSSSKLFHTLFILKNGIFDVP